MPLPDPKVHRVADVLVAGRLLAVQAEEAGNVEPAARLDP
jgi:hypothetical protein